MTRPAGLRATTAGTASRVGERQGGEGRDAASTHTARSAGQRPAGDAGPEAHSPCGEGEQMTEGGVLSSVRRGTTYQVRYASPHPHDMERQPYPCPDEGTLVRFFLTVGWRLGLSIGRSPNYSTRTWLCCSLSSLRHRGRWTSRALRGPSRRRST